MSYFFKSFILCLFVLACKSSERNRSVLKISVGAPARCNSGLYYNSDKSFAVYVFCDDAIGSTIGVINTAGGAYAGPGSEKAWSVENRFWQIKDWCIDVDFFRWSNDERELTVSTNGIYGTNKIYTLDLLNRKIIKITEK